ncbi:MAG: UvrD-helicase domain-containing protein, partial [Synergistaceae bacterium]|nr:UvrD-helicase domain-containing protein [Synergistaceae bacterium]
LKNGSGKILCSSLSQLASDEITSALRNIDISFAAITDTKILKPCTEFLDSLGRKRTARGIFISAASPAERQDFLRLLRSPAKVITGYDNPDVSLKVLRSEQKPSALRKLLSEKGDIPGVVFCSTPESVFKLREAVRDYSGLDDTITILPSRLYTQIVRKDIRFVVHYDLPENLAAYSREISIAGREGTKTECIMLVSRKELLSADNSVVKFCSAKKPKEFLLSYLGEDEKFSARNETTKPEGLTPEDFSDFDFGTANEAQKDAITSINGPMLIIAGPGTGKTYTLIQRAVFLIQKKHIKPENIMLATFTDKAAQELITRISEALSSRNILADTGSMYSGTFHALCSRILKDYEDFTGLGKTFRILDDFGHAYLIMQNFKRFEAIPGIAYVFKNPGKWKRSCELRDYISSVSEELIDPDELIADTDPAVSALGHAMKLHDEILRENDCMSYSALLAQTYRFLRGNPEILETLQRKIQYIMIDEYQDTNYVQEQLVFLLGSESKNICVVGDDDQSLYRFRGATVRNILEFPEKFGRNECKVIRLMLNYRSTPAIVEFASQWMGDTGEFFSWGNFRHPKKLEAHKPEAAYPSVMRLAEVNDVQGWHEKILAFLKSLKDSGAIADYSQTAFLFRSVK